MNNTAAIMAHLRKNPLKNITLLKMLSSFGPVMQAHWVEQGEDQGVLLLLPTKAYAYDYRTYPEAEYIVFMDYSSPDIFPNLLSLLPVQSKLVFKLQDEAYREALSEHFPLFKARGFFSYTSPPGLNPAPHQEAVIGTKPDRRLLSLWEGNHYSLEEVQEYFQAGAFSVSIFDGDTPVSTCLAFRNEEQVWEIGAVYTVDSHRGKGLAQKVVRTALHRLLMEGWIPRYHVLETNKASIALAESIGLVPCVTLGHWANYEQQ
jgi:GNAT superfamily N-acetyltransferase